ncbi:F-box/kelch-repeat protein At3g06240-like [Chenopodium quinoa]|uniref:F-box/kelch-repeat protein At3g06240-like n=1 Tax=Chenopodium quinoa TaxID=63459 RepID=UPI000B790B35|nr:F-box/kelch-repeat protein At3g06240-like [Chenopodium quinoa]
MEKKAKTDCCYLPFELITEILSWLPAKSLLRSACVSSSWYMLTKDPKFMKLHRSRSLKANLETHFLFECWKSKVYSFRATSQHPYYHASELAYPKDIIKPRTMGGVLGSCNGLVCFHSITLQPFYKSAYNNNLGLFLYNPATRATRLIPPLNSPMNNLLNHEVAFGYDSVSDDYKVLAICMERNDRNVEKALLYSLKTDAWVNIPSPPWQLNQFCMSPRPAILADNSFHWMNPLLFTGIRCFDLFTQRYYQIPHPVKREINYTNCEDDSELTILEGQLCIVTYTLEIWVLNKKKKSWTRIFHHLSGQLKHVDFHHAKIYNLGFRDERRSIILAIADRTRALQKVFICCDLQSKQAREIEATNLPDGTERIISFHPWVDSLVPLY